MKRIYFIDWMRIIAILVVFLFHNARFYDPMFWHVKNPTTSEAVLPFIGFINIWIMPLFFLLSGASAIFSLNKSFGEYVIDKVKRLGIPYAFGVLVLIPPQKYLEAITQHHYVGNFFQFLGYYFSGGIFNYPFGFSFAWLGLIAYHLWFLAHLLFISVMLFPVMQYVKNHKEMVIQKMNALLALPAGVLLLFIPAAIVRVLLKKSFPQYTDWADFFLYAVYFFNGFLLLLHVDFRKRIIKGIRPAFIIGVLFFVVYLLSFAMKGTLLNHLFQDNSQFGYYLFQESVGALTTWSWLVVLLGLGILYLDKESTWRNVLNEAVLPFYCLHQTIILIIGYFIVQLDWSMWSKFFVIATTSFLITNVIYFLTIKPFKPLRFLFGMKS